jgi:hypothetical protein
MSGDDCNIRVVARFRPQNDREKKEMAGRERKIINFAGATNIEVSIPGSPVQSFVFDYVFQPDHAQELVFDVVGNVTLK